MPIDILVILISTVGGIVGGLIILVGQFFLFKKESTFRKFLVTVDREDKFKLVALEKRLDKHQEAFSHWFDLVEVVHDEGDRNMKEIKRSREFWKNNCLYLDQESSSAFNQCIFDVGMYRMYLEESRTAKHEDREISFDINEIWTNIQSVGKVLAKGVGLPHLEPKVMTKYDKEGNRINDSLKTN